MFLGLILTLNSAFAAQKICLQANSSSTQLAPLIYTLYATEIAEGYYSITGTRKNTTIVEPFYTFYRVISGSAVVINGVAEVSLHSTKLFDSPQTSREEGLSVGNAHMSLNPADLSGTFEFRGEQYSAVGEVPESVVVYTLAGTVTKVACE